MIQAQNAPVSPSVSEEERIRTKLQRVSSIEATMSEVQIPSSFDGNSPHPFPRKEKLLRTKVCHKLTLRPIIRDTKMLRKILSKTNER
jgi:hypothetical protein